MATYGEWITRSTGIGAALGGVAGFFFAAYLTATSPALAWTDAPDTVGSIAVVLIYAVILGSFCIVIGGLAGLVLGAVSSPLSSFIKNARILHFQVNHRDGNIEKRDRAS
jgi:hypothetical protein